MSLESRRIQNIMITVNNCLINKVPESIKKLVSFRNSDYNLSGDNVLVIPKVNTTKNGLKSWSYFASKLWNDLDNDTRLQVGTKDFIRTIRSKTFEST